MEIKDKVVLITGSSSGIGRAVAFCFAKEGAKVVVNYHVNKEGGEETTAAIKNLGREALLVQADVAKPEDVKRLFRTVVEKFGTVDILVNNAALGTDKVPFIEANYEDIWEVLNTDLVSAMLCSQQAVRIMEKQGYGKILNTSSIRGWEHGGRAIVYAAAPGFVRTRSYDNMPPEKIEGFINQTFLKRWVTLDEVADTFLFLAKNDAMTGQVIYVDAGFTLK